MAANLVANITVSGNLNTLTMNSTTLNVASGFSLNNQLYTTSPASVYYINSLCLSIGLLAPQYQLDMSTDTARKLTTSTWLTGSDERIKTDIESANLVRCVEIVDSLDLKYFKWDLSDVNDKHSLGWIAQDVKKYFPKSIRTTQEHGLTDFHNLDSDQLIKTMYGALKHMINETYPAAQE